MKKSLLLMLFLALTWSWTAKATDLTVCNGTSNSEKVPFDGYNADGAQHNQMIFPANDLAAMNGMSISQIVFYIDASANNGSNTSATRLGTWTVSLGETTAISLSGLDSSTPLTQVYQGNFDCSSGTLTILFENEYVYKGGNLLVDMNHAASSWNRWYFLGESQTSNTAITKGSSYQFLPKTTFTYAAPPSCFKPSALVAQLTEGNGSIATLSWTPSGTETDWILEYGTASDFNGATSVNVSGTPSKDLTGLTAETKYYARVKADCGGGDESDWSAAIEFTPTMAAFIGDGTSTTSYAPLYGNYKSSYVQMIYTASQLGAVGINTEGEITKIGFNSSATNSKARNVKIYMGHTDKTQFTDASDFVTYNDLELVYDYEAHDQWSIVAGWNDFDLDAPFDYDGSSNLVIAVYCGLIDGYSPSSFYYSATTDDQVVYAYSDTDDPNPASFDPSAYSGSKSNSKNLPNLKLFYAETLTPKPKNFAVSNISAHGVTLSWEAPDIAPDHYEYQFKKSSEESWSADVPVNDLSANLSGLEANSDYDVRVRAIFDAGKSKYVSAFFTTLASCAVPFNLAASEVSAHEATIAWEGNNDNYSVQYRTAAYFDGEEQQFGSSIPSGWAQYTGLLSDVMGGTALTTATYGWSFGTGNGVFDNHARVNIYGTSCNRWLVTPAIQLAAGAKLTFDLALTAFSGNLAAPATTGVDDKFVVLASTDDGATWTILRQWDNADGSKYVYNNIACSATGENVTIDLSSYADQSVMIAFYGESTVANADNNLHIDNVAIGVPIAAGDWQTTSSTEKSAQLTSLIPETQYEVQVQGVCGAIETEWSESLFFTTIASCVAPTELAKSDVTAHGATLNWTSDGSAWQIMLNDDEENLINVTEKPYTLTSLAPETAYSAKVRTDCGNEYSAWSSAVSFTTAIACHVPTALAVQLTPGNGTVATLSWTAGEEGQNAWQICLNGDESNLIDVTENPYTLSGLIPETECTVKIRANCGDEDGKSAWSSVVSFEPTEKIVIGSGSATSNYLPSNTNFDYSLSQQIYTVAELGADAGLIESIDFYMTSATDYTRNLDIYMVSTDKSEFESATDWISVTASNLVFSGEVDFIGNSWTTITLDNGFIYEGLQNVAIIVDDNTGEYSSKFFKSFAAASNQAIYIYQDGTNIDVASPPSGTVITSKNQIRILKGEIPSCFKPTGLEINYTGGLTAEVSWTGEATSYNIDVNGVVTNGVTSPYELSGLELATTYEVKVQADCGSGNLSDWTSAASFSTDLCMPEDQCILTFELTDAWGDSWNGNAIRVTDVLSGKVLGEMANENLNGTTGSGENEVNIKTLSVCNGREIQFSWVKGSYPTETSWVVKDVNGQVLFSGAGTSSMETGEILYTHTVDCTHKFYLEIGTSGYATFYDEDYAYTMPAKLSGHTFNATTGLSDAIYEANQIIPAKEPLVMKAADDVVLPETFVLVEAETDALPSAGNDLQGNNEEGIIGSATDGNVYYVLSLNAAGEDESVGFYYMLENGVGGFIMPAHKAYLMYNASLAPAAFYLFNGENNATWLENLQGVEGTVKFMHEGNIYILRDSIIYDATGRKVRELK